jgi:hypothetical protein
MSERDVNHAKLRLQKGMLDFSQLPYSSPESINTFSAHPARRKKVSILEIPHARLSKKLENPQKT